MIAVPKKASDHNITHQSFSAQKQQVQWEPSLLDSLTSCVSNICCTHSRNLESCSPSSFMHKSCEQNNLLNYVWSECAQMNFA